MRDIADNAKIKTDLKKKLKLLYTKFQTLKILKKKTVTTITHSDSSLEVLDFLCFLCITALSLSSCLFFFGLGGLCTAPLFPFRSFCLISSSQSFSSSHFFKSVNVRVRLASTPHSSSAESLSLC